MALLCGALTGLGQAPFGLWPLALAGFVGLTLIFRATPGARAALLTGWLGGFGSYLVSLHWIVEPFLVDIARHGALAPLALVSMTGGMALFWMVAFGIARRWGGGLMGGLPALWALWSLSEMARGHVMTGFPWNQPGYIWLDWPPAQWASVIGPYGLTAGTLALAVLPAALGRWRIAAAAAPVALLAALFGGGVALTPATATTGSLVRLVQPNAAQHLKWDPDHAATFYARAIAATAAAPRPALIVWPETAIPALLNTAAPTLEHIAEAANGVPVVAGIQRRDDLGRYFNSLVRIGPGGAVGDLYDKHHLVPFGEYLPMAEVMSGYGLSALADLYGGGYSAGPGPRLIEAAPGLTALPLICYEAVFPEDATPPRGEPRPDLLLQLTNDAWFGGFSGPFQHLAQARFRAIEQRLPLARAANTGVSAMIDPAGRVTAELGLDRDGWIDAALPAPAAPGPYARGGDAPVALLLALFAAIALFPRGRLSD